MSVQSHDLHLLTGAYAVDALTGAELDEFEKHLRRCTSCTEEVRGLQETAARLGLTTAIEPPPWMRREVLAAAVAVAAVIVVLAVVQVNTRHQLEQTQQGSRAMAAVLVAPDAHIERSSTTVGGTVTAVISARDREAVVTTADMPAQADAKIYQLWVISGSLARSVGLLPGSATTGVTAPVLAADVQPGDRLAITVEPAGGTRQPTTTPIVLLAAND